MDNEEDYLVKAIREEMERVNSTPHPDMDYLSPIDMQNILYFAFSESSPIQYKKKVPDDTLMQIPFLNLVLEYLKILQENNEIKLTTKGNLPRRICLDLYGKKYILEEIIESGISKLSKEADSISLQNLKIICNLSGITKKRNNKISLTSKGKKLLNKKTRFELFQCIFETNYKNFNLGFHDGYPEGFDIQNSFGFTLYLLLRYGRTKKKFELYIEKNIKAFPFLLDSLESQWSTKEKRFGNGYAVRIFDRFLKHYGMVHFEYEILSDVSKIECSATDLFFEIFELKKENFKFRKTKNSA